MAAADTYDLLVIGAGPGGYVAAIRAAQLGMQAACIEREPVLGGTCLRVGCIPSKALRESSELFAETQSGLAPHGVAVGGVTLDLAAMLRRKDDVVRAHAGRRRPLPQAQGRALHGTRADRGPRPRRRRGRERDGGSPRPPAAEREAGRRSRALTRAPFPSASLAHASRPSGRCRHGTGRELASAPRGQRAGRSAERPRARAGMSRRAYATPRRSRAS